MFYILRSNRSRSNNGQQENSVTASTTSQAPATAPLAGTATQPRRRRPRSAHYDPNTVITPAADEFQQQDVNELYERLDKLGEGSYASVFKCQSRWIKLGGSGNRV